jgi:hypothetical protein
MKTQEIKMLLDMGAKDRVRKYLKRLAIPERMKALEGCLPLVKQSPSNLKFFKESFSSELGAILMSDGDLEKAVTLYRSALK